MNAAQINRYLQRKGSPLAGHGANFVRVGKRYGFDPLLLVAIAGAESEFGKTGNAAKTRNPFGWGPHIPFKTWAQAIETVGRGLKRGYFNEGRKTIEQIGAKWAPIGAGNDPTNLNSNWAGNVTRFYDELGGTGLNGTGGRWRMSPPGDTAAEAVELTGGEPDLRSYAFENLSEMVRGRYSPTKSLERLVQAHMTAQPRIRTTPQATTTTAEPPGRVNATTLDALLKSFGLTDAVTSGHRPGATTKRGTRSYHSLDRARDLDHKHPNIGRLIDYAKKNPSYFTEFFYDPLGWYIKNGRIIKGAIGGHDDHLHAAK